MVDEPTSTATPGPEVPGEPDAPVAQPDGNGAAADTGRRGVRAGWALAGVSTLAGLAAAGAAGMASHYAGLLTQSPSTAPEPPPRPTDEVTILAVGRDSVLLTGAGAGTPGIWGLQTTTGFGRIGPITARTPAGVHRPFTLLDGTITPDHGLLRGSVHADRSDELAADAGEVMIESEVGNLPAHQVRGDDLWVIGVHGRAASRNEVFRMLRPAVAAGHSALAIAYRNDRDAPASPDGRSHLGGTEWRDVVAAMDHARVAGATGIVLVGCSMGGAIVGQVLMHADPDDVVGVVLDSPVVDWLPVAAHAAGRLGLPTLAVHLLLPPTRTVARLRHDVDLASLRFDPAVLRVPTLLVHGSGDDVVPIAGSDELARDRRDIVSYLRVPGAGHVRAWNATPTAYDGAVRSLLTRIAT